MSLCVKYDEHEHIVTECAWPCLLSRLFKSSLGRPLHCLYKYYNIAFVLLLTNKNVSFSIKHFGISRISYVLVTGQSSTQQNNVTLTRITKQNQRIFSLHLIDIILELFGNTVLFLERNHHRSINLNI